MNRLAVTGTNGKTSTVSFVRQLLTVTGDRAASYGTLGLVRPDGRVPEPSIGFGPAALPALFDRLAADGVTATAVEAFSTALATGVYDRVTVDVAVFTNLDRDHLDAHGDMAAYYRAKRSLFADVLAADGRAVLNTDADRTADLRAVCRDRGIDVTTFGRTSDADVTVRDVTPTDEGTTATLSIRGRRATVALRVVGAVMVSNVAAAVAAALAIGVSRDDAVAALPSLRPPPGRLDRVAIDDGAELFVDYAHTPAALRAALSSLRRRTDGDLVVVFGCGGDRDAGKRATMGSVAADGADRVVVTDDNPRGEDPAAIRDAIRRGCPGARECIPRARAIEAAVTRATPGDVVLVAGKGHERTQVVGDEERPFSDHDALARVAGTSVDHRRFATAADGPSRDRDGD